MCMWSIRSSKQKSLPTIYTIHHTLYVYTLIYTQSVLFSMYTQYHTTYIIHYAYTTRIGK